MSNLDGYEFLQNFSDEVHLDEAPPFTTAEWLLNGFDSLVWQVNFGHKKPLSLDWRVELDNGDLLTAPQHSMLWKSLRHVLIIGVDGPNGEYKNLADVSVYLKFSSATKIIDYLLLNSESYSLREMGLAGINLDDLKSILAQLASSSHAEESIYEWRRRATAYCNEIMAGISDIEAQSIIEKEPSIAVISQEQIDELDLDVKIEDIPKMRAALKKAGMYNTSRSIAFTINSTKLSEKLYRRTLRGRQTAKSRLNILTYYPFPARYQREFPAVKVTTGASELLMDSTYYNYRNTLIHSAVLTSLGLPAPAIEDITAISEYLPPIQEAARFKSVPSDILMNTFKQGLEFHFEHGRMILNGFVRVARYCDQHQRKLSDINDLLLSRIIGEDLRNLGVKRMGLSCNQKGVPYRTQHKSVKDVYYHDLRANIGLLELVCVVLGVIQFTVGVIMARRVDELITLDAEHCLDETGSWLLFALAKSTRKARGMRQKEARPIDAIAVELIEDLRDFQRLLKRFNFIDKLGALFATPSIKGLKGLTSGSLHIYNRNLDFMCDYFETKVTDAGERYYIRQHQLRRFFAIVFFYMNGFGELDTLRWMLGHKDVEHVWRYLTECLGPKDIRGAGARYFTDLAKKDRLENYKDLQSLLEAEFGTKKISTVPEEKIEDYLEAMLEEGKARIEPHFFHDENGTAMRILFIVS
jgi:hypothetical protein